MIDTPLAPGEPYRRALRPGAPPRRMQLPHPRDAHLPASSDR
jgi:hypothetical protein